MKIKDAKCGDKVFFCGDRLSFTIQARNERFLVCTRPHFGTVLYTIVDLVRSVRGTENLIFCMGFEIQEECDEALSRLSSGESEVSYRNYVDLCIRKIKIMNP